MKVLDQLWAFKDHGTKSQAMAHSFRCSAHTRRSLVCGIFLDQGVTKVAALQEQEGKGSEKPLLDSKPS